MRDSPISPKLQFAYRGQQYPVQHRIMWYSYNHYVISTVSVQDATLNATSQHRGHCQLAIPTMSAHKQQNWDCRMSLYSLSIAKCILIAVYSTALCPIMYTFLHSIVFSTACVHCFGDILTLSAKDISTTYYVYQYRFGSMMFGFKIELTLTYPSLGLI